MNEAEAEIREEDRIGKSDEGIALRDDPLIGAKVIGLSAMAGLRKVVMTSRGTTRGKPLEGWARSSGPHWPQEETGSSEARDLPLYPDR